MPFLLRTAFLGVLCARTLGLTDAVHVRILNTPEQKIASRVKALTSLKSRLTALTDQKLLADQKPKIDVVLRKIDAALGEPHKTVEDLNRVQKEVQDAVEDLKGDLMRKAMELAQRQHDMLAKQKQGGFFGAGGNGDKEAATAEAAFEKLMDVQDAPIKQQLAVLARYKTDPFVAAFLENAKKAAKDGDNLAMQLGQALDNRKEAEQSQKQQQQLSRLQKSAHLNEDQAKTLLPILQKVREQKLRKQRKLDAVSRELSKLEDSERVMKKRKAVLSKETKTLGEAVSAIEKGKIAELSKAMDKLKQLTV